MKRAFAALIVCMLAAAQAPDPSKSTARRALDFLLASKYPEFTSLLSEQAKERLTPQFLREKVAAEIAGFGQLKSIGEPVIGKDDRNMLVSFPVAFSRATVNFQFTINPSQRVAGLYLRDANAPLPPVRQEPGYVKAVAFREREVTVGADPWKLGGTLLVPVGNGSFPVVVLVHGPGPNDRDETIFSSKIFRDLAEGLATHGIAVLRYDKRTKIYGSKMGDTDYTVEQETIQDAISAATLLRSQPGIDPTRVYLLGHSLGGYLAPRIAVRDNRLAGLIFLAANARPIEDVALDQNTYVTRLPGDPSPEAQHRLDALKAEVAKVKQLRKGASNPLVVMGLPSAYLLDLQGYNAPSRAKALGLPMLFLQGERDFQVTMTDFNLWKSALSSHANVTFHSYPDLNHLFISSNAKSTPAEYRVPGNVAREVVSDIAAWVMRQQPRR